jgi:hypothetical protein
MTDREQLVKRLNNLAAESAMKSGLEFRFRTAEAGVVVSMYCPGCGRVVVDRLLPDDGPTNGQAAEDRRAAAAHCVACGGGAEPHG